MRITYTTKFQRGKEIRCKRNIPRSIKISKMESRKKSTDKIKTIILRFLWENFYQTLQEDYSFFMETDSQNRKREESKLGKYSKKKKKL